MARPSDAADLMAALRASLEAARAGRSSDGAAPTPAGDPTGDQRRTCGPNGCPDCDPERHG